MPDYTNPYGRHTVRLSHGNWTQCADGGLIVHGPVEVDHCEVNRPGNSSAPYVPGKHLLQPGDGAVSRRFWEPGVDNRQTYWPGGPSGPSGYVPTIAEAIPIACVEFPPQIGELFRPPACGQRGNQIIDWFRKYPTPVSILGQRPLPKLYHLPADFDLSLWERLLCPYAGDDFSGWNTLSFTPGLQHPGYGSFYAAIVSQAQCIMLSDLPDERKHKLDKAMVQRGLDYAMACVGPDGREAWMVDGGHLWGRRPLMIYAGLRLGFREMIYLPPDVLANQVEHVAFPQHGNWWSGFQWDWKRHWTDGAWLYRHPKDWTTDERGERWRMRYLPDVLGAHVGAVLSLEKISGGKPLGIRMHRAVADWMSPLPAGAEQALRDNGCGFVADRWGTSYEVSGPAQFCARVWRGEVVA